MQHDPLDRWEWEGGALAVKVSGGTEEGPDETRGRPAVSTDRPDTAEDQPPSSTISSRRRPPGSDDARVARLAAPTGCPASRKGMNATWPATGLASGAFGRC